MAMPSGGVKTDYAIQQQQQQPSTAAAAPALSFAFNICPPSPESSPHREYLPRMIAIYTELMKSRDLRDFSVYDLNKSSL